MKVYLVLMNDDTFSAVFSTREKADEYVKNMKNNYWFYIVEQELN